jgi:hypothetical protein
VVADSLLATVVTAAGAFASAATSEPERDSVESDDNDEALDFFDLLGVRRAGVVVVVVVVVAAFFFRGVILLSSSSSLERKAGSVAANCDSSSF